MRHLHTILALALSATTAVAQDLHGRDTASNWRVTHQSKFGIWSSICDEREEYGELVQRCYLRWVDVFSGRPHFGGQFVFITPEDDGFQIEFGIEPGTIFHPNGFRIEREGAPVWRTRWPGCLTGVGCRFEGADADELIEQMNQGGAFLFDFRDRHGISRALNWPLEGFSAAWGDFLDQSRKRALIE